MRLRLTDVEARGGRRQPLAPRKNKLETRIDVAPLRRHSGSMRSDSKAPTVRSLDRMNLRLSAETFAQIGDACAARPGNVSLNTWITEAVEEKLARERLLCAAHPRGRSAHG